MFDILKKKAIKSALVSSILLILLDGVMLFFTAQPVFRGIFGALKPDQAGGQTAGAQIPIFACIVLLIGLVLVIWGIYLIVRAATGKSLKHLRNAIAAEGCSETTADADFQAAVAITKNGSIKVGRLFTYYMAGAVPKALPNSKMMWAYQTTTTHRTNGIKSGTTYSVNIFLYGVKNPVALSMPNEATTQAMLERLHKSFPWVVVGFSNDLKRLFNKDRQQFLSLRYNTVEHCAVDLPAAGEAAGNGQDTTPAADSAPLPEDPAPADADQAENP